jgi:hypothetical protein
MLRIAALLLAVAVAKLPGQDLPGVQVTKNNRAGPFYRFADVPWAARAETVREAMVKQGFQFAKNTENGDLLFDGRLFNQTTQVAAVMSKNGDLVKWVVMLLTPDNHAIDTYRDLREGLIKTYGPPHDDFEFYQTPYRKSDGYEVTAIKVGKGHLASYWSKDSDGSMLSIEVTEALNVYVGYESAAFHDENARRKAQQTSIFGKPPIQ